MITRRPHRLEIRRLRLAMLVLGLVIVIVLVPVSSCGSPQREYNSPISAPDFPFTVYQGGGVLGGDELQFSDLFQGKPVVLNFWAGLCAPCLAEMPEFQRVYDLHKEQFLLLGLDIGPSIDLGSVEEGKSLLQELGITYPTGTSKVDPIIKTARGLN